MISKMSQVIKECVDNGFLTVDIESGTVIGKRGKPLKWIPDRNGFCMVSLKLNHFYVHRIVAYAKYGDSALVAGMDIDHIDHNKFNNRGDNLQILTHAQNANEGRKNASKQREPMAYKVIDIITSKTIAIFSSMELAKEYSMYKFNDEKFATIRRRRNGTWYTAAHPSDLFQSVK